MINQLVLVGRIAKDLEIKESENGNKHCELVIAVKRSFKNSDGIYETDLIPCGVWCGIAENVVEYCQKGDVIGVKGRIQINENGIYVIAEKVTFVSSRKEEN